MLRLVHPSQPKPLRGRRVRHEGRVLSGEEQRRAVQALKNLRDAFGSPGCLAQAMAVSDRTLYGAIKGQRPVSAALLVRAMRASGLSLAELLGKPVPADRCRACGKVRAA